ncbi:hypothetical protein B0J18DRAFT_420917 [Chaetomium sp. MPI-SDFR-AT-0129]|nr:hypothetical protein B0J18DRAFT_420917 [Chaetomium sp. MPI-SDFR-AT-0129]
MRPAARLCLSSILTPLRNPTTTKTIPTTTAASVTRAFHTTPITTAKVVPVYGTGPPPRAPEPSAEFVAEERAEREERLARRRRQAELLRHAGGIQGLRRDAHAHAHAQTQGQTKEQHGKKSSGLKRRFWKDVSVKEVDGSLEIHLDSRPLRHPTTKAIIRLPLTKPHLAHALALEWDSLTSAQQATKQHLIPLTSLICRALDIANSPTPEATRTEITTTLLRYLDTDSLLCFAPVDPDHDPSSSSPHLRELQEQAYESTTRYLTTHAWPGISIIPVLDGTALLPVPQSPGTREVIQAWVMGLSPFELAGLERATLAGKSLLAAARLIVEWSEEGAGKSKAASTGYQNQEKGEGNGGKFGVEEASRAVSLEVDWQTGRWGEVEDTHDVQKEDVRRQFGSTVLLVSGQGTKTKSG